ncbi:hypothetical protein MFIFM68171_06529 [Madurella fahalii]|uniref:Uncharacterized protein n=1 Tax=Madurella fahalii TaxID=1157608 RepID=A0ABQ0GF68_9PEZI
MAPTNRRRPGVILVHAGLTHPAEFTAADLTNWYEAKHIPEVLATPGVGAAAWYQMVSRAPPPGTAPTTTTPPPPPPPTAQPEERRQEMPYLAVYRLADLGWLHEEGCEFWQLPLGLPGRGEKMIWDVGAFETRVWEEVGVGDGDGGGGEDKKGWCG